MGGAVPTVLAHLLNGAWMLQTFDDLTGESRGADSRSLKLISR